MSASPDPLVRYRWSQTNVEDGLQVYQLHPRSVVVETKDAFTNARSAASSDCDVEVRGPGSIRFDFGVESPAWLEFDSPDLVGEVEMSISEYNRPGQVMPNTGPRHPIKTAVPERIGNTYRLVLNAELYEGVRFGWIHVRSTTRSWHITAVRVVCQAKPANYVGDFSCGDDRLERIWYTGAYTARVGFQADHLGAILMDRGDRFSWAGDCYPHQAASMVAFGNTGSMLQNLRRIAGESNGIEMYSLYWVLLLVDYHQFSGDDASFLDLIGAAGQKLDHADSLFAAPQSIFFGWDERLGAGFERPTYDECKQVFRATYIQACTRMAQSLHDVGETGLARNYRDRASTRIEELRASGSHWFESWGVHARAEAVLAGAVEPDELDAVYQGEFDDRLNRLSFSPFNQYFILRSMTRLGRIDEALQTVEDCWGKQLDFGGTTFFEVFRPEWVDLLKKSSTVPNSQSTWTSMAHPWSAGVTAWLTHDVLGIRPTSPGFRTFDFAPQPGRTLDFVQGTVPTPAGPVQGRFEARSGRGRLQVPRNTTARFVVPDDGREVKRVSVRGRVAGRAVVKKYDGSSGGTKMIVDGLGHGSWDLTVTYRGRRANPPQETFGHPLPFRGTDHDTGGDWGGVYGRHGHLLFSYDGVAQHRGTLPDYVKSAEPLTSAFGNWSVCDQVQWVTGTDDRRALAADNKNAVPRNTGVVFTRTPIDSGMTMVLDVVAEPPEPVQLSLYVVDWDSTVRRMLVETFDQSDRKLLTPVQLVEDFNGGAYLRFTCDRPMRFRFAHIEGANAVVNGIFFDPIT